MSRQAPFSIVLLALVAAVTAFAAFGLVATSAHAANALEKNFWLEGPRYDGDVPPCEAMLGKVASHFAQKESKYWNSDLQITGFAKVRELAFQPWQSGNIPRRFCTAQAAISDGKVRTVNFSIIEDGGLISVGPGVEFCVIGLDRNWAYSPGCRMARP
jgi:hypothetical protein